MTDQLRAFRKRHAHEPWCDDHAESGCTGVVIPCGPGPTDFVYLAQDGAGRAAVVIAACPIRALTLTEALALKDAIDVATSMALAPTEEEQATRARGVVAAFNIGFAAGAADNYAVPPGLA